MSVSGVLVIDKAEGMTSHDVVNRIRLRFRKTKVGHLGTLDPMATGVLPICLGKATRIGQFLESSPKEYTGEMRLGFSTTTFDRLGPPAGEERPVGVSRETIESAIQRFVGDIEQVPPPFSAKKIGGVPSYKFARRGRPIATPAVTVRIERFEVTRFAPPYLGFAVTCSPGTYVRSLAHDLGHALACGAHLTSLRRTRSGRFTESDATTISDVDAAKIIPLEKLLEGWVQVNIEDHEETRIAHGNPVPGPAGPKQFARIFNKRDQFVAVGLLENGWVHPRVVLTSMTSESTTD
jgi:tRNA pseudouridine55 synthase